MKKLHAGHEVGPDIAIPALVTIVAAKLPLKNRELVRSNLELGASVRMEVLVITFDGASACHHAGYVVLNRQFAALDPALLELCRRLTPNDLRRRAELTLSLCDEARFAVGAL